MAVTKYLNPNYIEGGSEPKYITIPNISAGGEEPDLSNYLAKDNTTEFTPVNDYNPATKKYVDDKEFCINENDLASPNIDLFNNLKEAIQNSRTIYLISSNTYSNVKYPLMSSYYEEDESITLSYTDASIISYNNTVSQNPTIIKIDNTGTISFSTDKEYPVNNALLLNVLIDDIIYPDNQDLNSATFKQYNFNSLPGYEEKRTPDYINIVIRTSVENNNNNILTTFDYLISNWQKTDYKVNVRLSNNSVLRLDIGYTTDMLSIKGKYIQRILTETEYNNLGSNIGNDVLYFVTPD